MKSIRSIFKIGRGPSSSHTMGPERAATVFKGRYPDADQVQVTLYGSLSKTGKGHGTDRVLLEVLSPTQTEIIFSDQMPEGVTHPNTMDFSAWKDGRLCGSMRAVSIGGGDIQIDGHPSCGEPDCYQENSFSEIERYCHEHCLSLTEYVERNEGAEIWPYLRDVWRAMERSIQEGLAAEGILPGGLNIARKAKSLLEQKAPQKLLQIGQRRVLCAYAYAVSEQNASCGTVVTAPTCGACGVLPAVLRYTREKEGLSEDQVIKGLAVAGLFGALIKQNASVSGAECGCQAEIGSACSMAAAAQATLLGLSISQTQHAAEIALEHHLGLTCDPVCGLVQVPCIERNAVAAMRAVDACGLAYFVSDTQRISFDLVVKTMYETGININQQFRETSQGGLAKMYGTGQ